MTLEGWFGFFAQFRLVSEPARILYITTSTARGGSEKILWETVRRLDKKRFQAVGVICLKPLGDYAKPLQETDVPVESLGLGRLPTPGTFFSLYREIRRLKPDLVHGFLFKACQMARILKMFFGYRLISSPRTTYRWFHPLWRKLDTLLARWDDVTLCESESSAKFFRALGGSSRVAAVPNGIDAQSWRFSSEGRERIRREFKIEKHEKLIGCVTHLNRMKGIYELARAAKGVCEKDSAVRFLVVGSGEEGREFENYLRQLGLQQSMILAGERADIVDCLSAMDIFAFPSHWEGMPNAVLEAMAIGLPIAASDVDSIPELIQHEATGLLVPPGDSISLERALLRMLQEKTLAEGLGKSARKKAETAFSIEKTISSYEAFYEEILQAS